MTPHWESAVIALAAFGILYWFLSKRIFKPLFGVIDKRRELIQGQISSADASRKQSEQLLEEAKQAIQQARKEAYDIIEQAKVTSVKQAEDIVEQAKNESNRLKAEALKEIESEKNKAVSALRSQVSAMSVLIASKIIEKQIDEKSQEQLIDSYLKEVGGKL